ncbi:MAG: TRAP transporter fused permease subunit [Angelakisella sp.]
MGQTSVNPPKSTWLKFTDLMVCCIAIGMALFHLYTASLGAMTPYAQTAIHWAFVGSYIVLTRPLKFWGGRIIDILFIGLNLFLSYYLLVIQENAIQSAGIYSQMEVLISILAVVCALAISWRVLGPILPVICILFMLYGLYGRYIPGIFKTGKFSVQRLATDLYANVSSGMYGQTLYVSAQFIFLFVLFGTLLELTGAGEFFVDLAFSVAGKSRGGPAQAAVYSSMLMGTINGSGAANVVTTGTFTIPLMKKVGYSAGMSGAVEAVASSGGQIMPPVMGAVAFLMSEVTGIEYGTIALAAFIPAVLYYVTLSVSVYFTARKENIPAADASQIKKFSTVLKEGWLYFIPLVVLVGILLSGYSAKRSAFFAIIATMVVGYIKRRENMTAPKIMRALKGAVAGIAAIAAACICAGIIMDVINLTGLGLKISGIITGIANGNLMIALILAMLTSLVLGMGLPTSAAYMILAVLVAPALVKMGITPLAAHLFILYFGALSTITPPVALSTFAAAGIAEAGIWDTGYNAMKLASTGFIIPFVFAYNYELLMVGTPLGILWALSTAIIGCTVLSMALIGWGGKNLHLVSRALLFPCGILLFLPKPIWANLAGIAITVVILLAERMLAQKQAKQ